MAEESLEYVDVILINRYAGWYQHSGQIDLGINALKLELDQIHEKHGKPMVVSEFGADTIAGTHSDPPEMWSEEYQEELIKGFLDLADRTKYLVGLLIWNFADFKTSQSVMRSQGLNQKGVFTRDRQPKKAAHMLRDRWGGASG
jgi:beta-glucuronidase